MTRVLFFELTSNSTAIPLHCNSAGIIFRLGITADRALCFSLCGPYQLGISYPPHKIDLICQLQVFTFPCDQSEAITPDWAFLTIDRLETHGVRPSANLHEKFKP